MIWIVIGIRLVVLQEYDLGLYWDMIWAMLLGYILSSAFFSCLV